MLWLWGGMAWENSRTIFLSDIISPSRQGSTIKTEAIQEQNFHSWLYKTVPCHLSSHRNVNRPLSVKTTPTGVVKPTSLPHFPFSAHARGKFASIAVSKSPSKTELIFREKMFHNSCGTEIRTNKTCHSWKFILENLLPNFTYENTIRLTQFLQTLFSLVRSIK